MVLYYFVESYARACGWSIRSLRVHVDMQVFPHKVPSASSLRRPLPQVDKNYSLTRRRDDVVDSVVQCNFANCEIGIALKSW